MFNIKDSKEKDQKGFTFLEMIIAIFVFSLLATAVAGIYVAFSNLQRRSQAYQQILNDSHFAIELMAREFRTGTIYDYTPEDSCASLLSVDNPSECILIIREDGQLIAFTVLADRALYLITPNCEPGYVNCTWSPETDTYTVLLGEDLNSIQIAESEGLRFRIYPDSDPFEESSGINRQPMVTLRLETEYVGNQEIEDVGQALQTTVSARIYQR